MKIQYILILLIGFFQVSIAQEDAESKPKFPQFEECETDDQAGKSCFENNFRKMFKEAYKETEIASDYTYQRETKGTYLVDRRGVIKQLSYDTPESPIFLAISRAVEKLPKLKAVLNDKDRPVEFNFEVNYKLKRNSPNSKNDLEIDLEFSYPDPEKENS
ncbi:hypothetical protein [Psychroflexus planctonicus]|uniref:Uncharacterized protein n=1 Tax=Psychroflexus planctonicus TaxID=1526575 RepID=A0ABQ1SB37_9FLAO|nr:hypothetical protein [Psychroflexus planctonicus]GGE24272.1 hypothetical protein GCM10010832_01190 [Psychroflexus planctonicus]